MQTKYSPLLVFAFFLLMVSTLSAQDTTTVYESDEKVIITSNKIPTHFSDLTRSVSLIDTKEIGRKAVQSVPELLAYTPGLSVRARGTQGIQADIGIRGASFNQTLVLIDGIKQIDPQTGHHSMNLPLHIDNIAQIEILKGPGSRLYGTNAFGGVVNIITKNSLKPTAKLGGKFGDFNLYDTFLSLAIPIANSSHAFTISQSRSDGYRANTDFKNVTLSHKSIYQKEAFKAFVSSGYNSKDFGANSFYTSKFPWQYEETRLFTVQGGAGYHQTDWNVQLKSFYREHEDLFLLKRNDPSFYKNEHKSKSYGAELESHYFIDHYAFSLGAEIAKEEINSTNLGEHKRNRGGFFAQGQLVYNAFTLALGSSLFHYSGEGWQMWPGLDASYKLGALKFFLSTAMGFRVPTYTELYYKDPVTVGNADLKPEESINVEFGLNWQNKLVKAELTLFGRNNKNLIDYVLNTHDNLYYAQNFTKINSSGVEVALTLPKALLSFVDLNFSYTYINSDKDARNRVSRYTLTHLEHQFITALHYNISANGALSQNWQYRYEERLLTKPSNLVDTRIVYQHSGHKLYAEVTNIFHKKYEDFPGVIMPGRWFKAGFEFNILD